MFNTTGPIIKLCAGGKGNSGGHVLSNVTSSVVNFADVCALEMAGPALASPKDLQIIDGTPPPPRLMRSFNDQSIKVMPLRTTWWTLTIYLDQQLFSDVQ
jgi:hypothetical protein